MISRSRERRSRLRSMNAWDVWETCRQLSTSQVILWRHSPPKIFSITVLNFGSRCAFLSASSSLSMIWRNNSCASSCLWTLWNLSRTDVRWTYFWGNRHICLLSRGALEMHYEHCSGDNYPEHVVQVDKMYMIGLHFYLLIRGLILEPYTLIHALGWESMSQVAEHALMLVMSNSYNKYWKSFSNLEDVVVLEANRWKSHPSILIRHSGEVYPPLQRIPLIMMFSMTFWKSLPPHSQSHSQSHLQSHLQPHLQSRSRGWKVYSTVYIVHLSHCLCLRVPYRIS